MADCEPDGHQSAEGGDDRGEQHPCHVRHGQEHEAPAGHEDQGWLWAEHPSEKNGPHDRDETEPPAGSRDRRGGDTVPGMGEAQPSPGCCHDDRDECQSQDLDGVGNVVPDESQQTDPG